MKAMMAKMLEAMNYMAANSDVIRDASVKTSNKNFGINPSDLTDPISKDIGKKTNLSQWNKGGSFVYE